MIPTRNDQGEHTMKSIRSIASTIALIACSAALSLTPARAQAQAQTQDPHLIGLPAAAFTLVGTWRVTVSPDGIPPFRAYNVFMADGNSLEFDNSNPPSLQ